MPVSDAFPLIDHHCHGVVTGELDRRAFESLLCEADQPGPWHGSLFDTHAGLAVRRLCAPMLGLPTHADPDEYLARRADLGATTAISRLLSHTGITEFLVDTGLTPDVVTTPNELAAFATARGREIVRIEQVAEQVMSLSGANGLVDEFAPALAERATGAVACKSVAAYRCGLDLAPDRPTDRAVSRAATQWARELDAGAPLRLVDETLIRHGIWTALDLGRPLQLHVGYGDRDIDLARADPLLLMPLLHATVDAGAPIMLLHNYPFHRHAGYLAQVFDHVFVDVGLALHNVGPRADAVLAELLELAPVGSVLFSTDAYGLAELYVVAVAAFRHALDAVLDDGLARDAWTVADAERFAAMICRDNARRAYSLDER